MLVIEYVNGRIEKYRTVVDRTKNERYVTVTFNGSFALIYMYDEMDEWVKTLSIPSEQIELITEYKVKDDRLIS